MDKLGQITLHINSLIGVNSDLHVPGLYKIKLPLYYGPKVFMTRHANYLAHLLPGDITYQANNQEMTYWTLGGLLFLQNHLLKILTSLACKSIDHISSCDLSMVKADLQKQYHSNESLYARFVINASYIKINNKNTNK